MQLDIGAHELGSGDYDCNRAVDLTDFAHWQDCMTDPTAGERPPGCEALDFDADFDTDLADFAAFQNSLGDPK